MKKYVLIVCLIIVALATLALKSVDSQQRRTSYAIIFYSTNANTIQIQYGGEQATEEIKLKKDENSLHKIVDVLNTLSLKGYELVTSNGYGYTIPLKMTTTSITGSSSNSTITNAAYVELCYTLKKVEN